MAHGGKYILVGLYKDNLTFNHTHIDSKETTLLCSRNATIEDMLRVKEILLAKQFPVADFISHEVGIDEMIEHFDSWIKTETRVIKAMVSF